MKTRGLCIFVCGVFLVLDSVYCKERKIDRVRKNIGDIFQNILNSIYGSTTASPVNDTSSGSYGGNVPVNDSTTMSSSSTYGAKTTTTGRVSSPYETSTQSKAYTTTTRTTSAGVYRESTKRPETENLPPQTTKRLSFLTTLVRQEAVTTTTQNPEGDTKPNAAQRSTVSQPEIPMLFATTTMDPRCTADQLLDHYCLGLPESIATISFWDIYYTMLSDGVLRALLLECGSGHWCLSNDKFDYYEAMIMEKTEMIMRSEVFSEICDDVATQQCLDSIVVMTSNCSTSQQINFTTDAIRLICKLKQDPTLTSNCFEELLISLHVTDVDILRDQNQKEDLESGFEDDTCITPEAEMTKTFMCLENRCPNHAAELADFRSWRWFTGDIDVLKQECDFPSDTCISTYKYFTTTSAEPSEQGTTEPFLIDNGGNVPDEGNFIVPSDEHVENIGTEKHKFGIAWTEPVDAKTMIGISVGTFVTVLGLTVLAFICWRNRKAKAGKSGYAPLRNDDP